VGTLLVVGRDVWGHGALERALGARGHTVLSSTDAPSALAVADAEGPTHVLVCDIERRATLVRQLSRGDRVIALVGGPVEPELARLARFADPIDPARVAAWLEKAQPRPRSGRRARVRPRCVLFCVRSRRSSRIPPTVRAEVVTTTAAAYEALAREHDLVVIDDALEGARSILAVAVEQGRCVYVLTDDGARAEELLRLGAAGTLSWESIEAVADVPLERAKGAVPMDAAFREEFLRLLDAPLPHAERMRQIGRLLLGATLERHKSVRRAAAAAGLSRTTFLRGVRDDDES
jgi:hypothetical protein